VQPQVIQEERANIVAASIRCNQQRIDNKYKSKLDIWVELIKVGQYVRIDVSPEEKAPQEAHQEHSTNDVKDSISTVNFVVLGKLI